MKKNFHSMRMLAGVTLLAGLAGCGGGSSTSNVSLGGTVTGLTAGSVVLTDGTINVTVPANATSFTFPTRIAVGATYAVQVSSTPTDTACMVSNGTGTASTSDISNVQLACVPEHSLGGVITGLTSDGLVLANGSDTVSPAANSTTFIFPHKVGEGYAYGVTVLTQPAGHQCTVQNDAGHMGTTDVTNVQVTCS